MFYSYRGTQVNPPLRGSDRLVISPRRGRHHGVGRRLWGMQKDDL